MASVAVMHIELAPLEIEVSPRSSSHSPSTTHCNKSEQDAVYSEICPTHHQQQQQQQQQQQHMQHPLHQAHHTSPTPPPPPPLRGTGYSSGYLSSTSHLHSPKPRVKPNPPKFQREGDGGRGEESSDCSMRREFSSSIGGYHTLLQEDWIYSRLNHSPASTIRRGNPSHYPRLPTDYSSTSTLQQQATSHQPHPLSLQGDTPIPGASHVIQSREDLFHSTPRHSHPRHSHPITTRRQNTKQHSLLLKKLEGLNRDVQRWVVKADQSMKRCQYGDSIPFLEATISRTEDYPQLQLLLWEMLGKAHLSLSHYKKASICYLHHLAHSRARNDLKSMSRAECNLGIIYMKMGLLKLSGRCFLQYLRNCRNTQDEMGIQSACSNLGLLAKAMALKNYQDAMAMGDGEAAVTSLRACLRRAIIFFKQHLEITLAHGDIEKQGRVYGNIGSCYELLKEYSDAIFYHQKRLDVVRMLGDRYSESCTLCNIGNSLRAKGNFQEGLEYYHMNLEMALSVGDYKMEELTHMNLGITYELMGEIQNAIASYTMYLGMVVLQGDFHKQARGFATLAKLYLETQQLTKAHEYYQNLVGVFQKVGDHTSMKSAQVHLKYVQRMMKRDKRGKKGINHTYFNDHTPSPRHGRHRSNTVSQGSHFHQEMSSLNSRHGVAKIPQGRGGTWSGGMLPHPQREASRPSVFPLDQFTPDPILALADMSAPIWGVGQGAGYDGESVTSGYPFYSTTATTTLSPLPPLLPPRAPTQDHTFFYNHHHTHMSSLDSSMETRSFSSDDYITTSHADHTHSSEMITNNGYRNEDTPSFCGGGVGGSDQLRGAPALWDQEEGECSGRSTALPYLSSSSSSCSSITTSPDTRDLVGSEDEGEGLIHNQNMTELQRAGLDLVRAGLELAGYEGMEDLGIHDDVVDKEWRQWQLINETEEGNGFGSIISVAGTQFKNHRRGYLRNTFSAPNI